MISRSVEDTIKIGFRLGRRLESGDVVALTGDLGAGKTVFTKGIAKGLGVKDMRYVNSPTFVIIKEHKGRLQLYHFDLYRIDKSSLIDSENFEEYFYGNGVSVVEWADKIPKILPPRRIEVRLEAAGKSIRKISIKHLGPGCKIGSAGDRNKIAENNA